MRKEKPYHHGDLRKALLDATDALVRESGIESATIRAVARRAEVSHAAPLHYFPDRTALLSAYVANLWEGMADRMEAVTVDPSDPAYSRLLAIGIEYVRFGLEFRHAMPLMLRPELCMTAEGEPHPGGMRAYHALRNAVGDCTDDPERQDALCWLAQATVHGFVEISLTNPDDRAALERAERSMRLMRPTFVES